MRQKHGVNTRHVPDFSEVNSIRIGYEVIITIGMGRYYRADIRYRRYRIYHNRFDFFETDI